MTTASGPLKEAIGSLDEVPAGRRDPIPAGGLAGMSADRFGIRRTLLTAIVLLGMLIIRCTTEIPALFWMVLVTWGVLSWAITPPIQSHLVQLSSETSDIQQSA